MPVSIEDVAKKANVSISTVSRVLNSKNIVNQDTKKRVEEAIEELGYRPNVFARGLMLQKSNILALVLPDLHGEFYSEIIRGANLKARELGYHMMISSVDADDDGKDVLSTVSSPGLADGIIVMVSDMDSKIRKTLKKTNIPIVLLDGEVPDVKHDTVVIDQRMGADAMVRHILAGNETDRIIFIGGPQTNLDTIDRLAAYKQVMTEVNRTPINEDIVHLDYSYKTAFEYAIERVMEWSSVPTTIFAANDEMAAAIVDAAIAATLNVPQHLRVVGFDDTRIAQLTHPRLTTVRVPMADMGAIAVELLCKRITEENRPASKVTLQAEVVIRESCGSRLNGDQ